MVFPGETLRTRVWREDDRLLVTTSAAERDDAPVLADTVLSTDLIPGRAPANVEG